jgi:hypothetical protein
MDPESTLLVFKDEEVGRKNSGFGTFNVGAENGDNAVFRG